MVPAESKARKKNGTVLTAKYRVGNRIRVIIILGKGRQTPTHIPSMLAAIGLKQEILLDSEE